MRHSSRLGYRLFKMRLAGGVLLSLPLVLVSLWYAWGAWAQIDRYKRGTDDVAVWSLELFHIALHDELKRDYKRVTRGDRVASGALPTFSLSLDRENFDALNRQLYDGAERSYVDGYMQKDGDIHPIKARHKGNKPWHWIGAQKSLKLRLQRGDLIDGTRVFNLGNDPTPFGLEVPVIFTVARDLGLLVPDYGLVRLRLNNSDMGVYHYAAQPVEGVLRRGRRMPGALYSGATDSLDAERGVGGLFFGTEGWQQVSERAKGAAGEFAPLEELLARVQHASHAEFAAYAGRRVDLQRYAAFDALDVVFGGNEHDYFSNHKLYFDPYRGRFEPVVWGFRGFRHEPAFNLVDHPLLVRLKMTPQYRAGRDRAVFELLTGAASVPRVRRLAQELFAEVAADLAADPYWDAYKLLPRVTRFHRFMVRPMSREKWLLAARAELRQYGRRARYLLDQLEEARVNGQAYPAAGGLTRLDLVAADRGAWSLGEVEVAGACSGGFEMSADLNRDGRLDIGDRPVAVGRMGTGAAVDAYSDLLPGVLLRDRPDPLPKRGTVHAVPEARTYTYLIDSPCRPQQVSLAFTSRVTGRSSRLELGLEDAVPRPRRALPSVTEVPGLVAGQRSPHPWDYPVVPSREKVALGPGLVRVEGTRVFAAHQEVEIAAGTRIEMGAGANLVFGGRVKAVGTAAAPIRIRAADPARPFGGVALRGLATAGSVFRHVHVEGGSRVGALDVDYASLFSVFDSRDLVLDRVRLSAAGEAENVLHVAYVEEARLYDVTVEGAPADGVDIEFSSGEARGLRVLGAGDDCLDLMGVDLRVADSVLRGCTNNAVSVGEESRFEAHGLFIGDSGTGLLAKNDSHARLSRSLVYRSDTALKTKRRQVHYSGPSSIGANDLFVVDCAQAVDAAGGTRIEVGLLHRSLPAAGALEHLARRVLGLPGWGAFGQYVARFGEGGRL